MFGYNSFGWRFPSAVAGAVAVVVLVRLTRRLTGSTLIGLIAGLLLALDGFSFACRGSGCSTSSCRCSSWPAVACLVVDRDTVRARVRAMDGDRRGSARAAGASRPVCSWGRVCGQVERGLVPRVLRRPVAVLGPRRVAGGGGREPTRTMLRRGLPGAVWALGAVPVLTYLA